LRLSQQLGWIGVDIGTHTVKLAQVVRDGGEVRLHRAAVIQRPTSWAGDDALALEQPIPSSFEIQAALESGGFSGKNALCTLPMNVCQLRCLNVPPGTEVERRTIIGGELAEDWAELRQPMEFDFWEMETGRSDKASEAFNVSVLAASRLWVSQLWRDCRKNRLDCWAIDGAPLTIARAIGLVGGATGGRRVLAIDWGYSNTTLCVVGDEWPLYCRRVHECGFGRVLDGVMQAFDVTLDEAQYLADTQGLHSTNSQAPCDATMQSAITQAAEGTLDELVRQIRRTLSFTESQRRHLQPAAIWLMGGGAAMRNVADYLSQIVGLPVHIWSLTAEEAAGACTAGTRAAVFSAAATLSAAAWRAA
jgi:type IV pilus assembly protein PilM